MGPAWAKAHHFDTPGKLPARVSKKQYGDSDVTDSQDEFVYDPISASYVPRDQYSQAMADRYKAQQRQIRQLQEEQRQRRGAAGGLGQILGLLGGGRGYQRGNSDIPQPPGITDLGPAPEGPVYLPWEDTVEVPPDWRENIGERGKPHNVIPYLEIKGERAIYDLIDALKRHVGKAMAIPLNPEERQAYIPSLPKQKIKPPVEGPVVRTFPPSKAPPEPRGQGLGSSVLDFLLGSAPGISSLMKPPDLARGTEDVDETQGYARGSTDTIPAMLTPHEAVLNVHAANILGRDKIAALNRAGNKLANVRGGYSSFIPLSKPLSAFRGVQHFQVGVTDTLFPPGSAGANEPLPPAGPQVQINPPTAGVTNDPVQLQVINRLGYDPSMPQNRTGFFGGGPGTGGPTRWGIGAGATVLGNLLFPGAGLIAGPLARWITSLVQRGKIGMPNLPQLRMPQFHFGGGGGGGGAGGPQGGYYSPEYLRSIGYEPGQGTGSLWPGAGPSVGPYDVGAYGVGGGGGSFFHELAGGRATPVTGATFMLGQGTGGLLPGSFGGSLAMHEAMPWLGGKTIAQAMPWFHLSGVSSGGYTGTVPKVGG